MKTQGSEITKKTKKIWSAISLHCSPRCLDDEIKSLFLLSYLRTWLFGRNVILECEFRLISLRWFLCWCRSLRYGCPLRRDLDFCRFPSVPYERAWKVTDVSCTFPHQIHVYTLAQVAIPHAQFRGRLESMITLLVRCPDFMRPAIALIYKDVVHDLAPIYGKLSDLSANVLTDAKKFFNVQSSDDSKFFVSSAFRAIIHIPSLFSWNAKAMWMTSPSFKDSL